MYRFNEISCEQYSSLKIENRVPFEDPSWIDFLVKLKGIKPIFVEIQNEQNGIVGYFVGGLVRFFCIKVLGSPFWGWMGQHIGFTLLDSVQKDVLVDEFIDFAFASLKVGYIQMCSFNIEFEDIKNCKHQFITGERYTTCYIDLSLPEDVLQKNLKSGYRTSIRKFYKDGGYILEDYSEEFIEEHHRQLNQVFVRNNLKTPNYREKMSLLLNSPDFSKGIKNRIGVYFIKAMLPVEENGTVEDKCVASSYYILNDYMAMFASNASYTQYLRSCPNQALTWHAMMAFKEAGIHYLDMGGSGSYKLNFSGGGWQPRPIIICSKNKFNYFLILGLKRNYAKVSKMIGESRNWIKSKLLNEKGFGLKEEKHNPVN